MVPRRAGASHQGFRVITVTWVQANSNTAVCINLVAIDIDAGRQRIEKALNDPRDSFGARQIIEGNTKFTICQTRDRNRLASMAQQRYRLVIA